LDPLIMTTTRLIRTLLGLAVPAALLAIAASRRRRTVPATAAIGDVPSVVVVDDPDGSTRLLGAIGPMHDALLTMIDDAMRNASPHPGVHLDVSGVTDWPIGQLERLEDVLDRAERDGLRLRVVGIDPRLPAASGSSVR
jgi:hypothetical protein